MGKKIDMKKIDATPQALFHQVLAILFPEHSDFEVMPVDKVQGKFKWFDKEINVIAYRVFSVAKGHPVDLVRVDLKMGEK